MDLLDLVFKMLALTVFWMVLVIIISINIFMLYIKIGLLPTIVATIIISLFIKGVEIFIFGD